MLSVVVRLVLQHTEDAVLLVADGAQPVERRFVHAIERSEQRPMSDRQPADGISHGRWFAGHHVPPPRPAPPERDKPGVAHWVYDHNEPYLVQDTATDPNYTRYLQDVYSIAAVPICYQRRPIGVISVSAPERDAFSQDDIAALEELANSAAKFVRRAQLDSQSQERTGRPFFIRDLSDVWLEV